MKKIGFWIPCIVGALITPLFFYASTLSGGGAASHAGAGFQMILFYPIPFLPAIFLMGLVNNPSLINQLVSIFCIGLAVIQFPLFGFVFSYANLKKGSVFFFFDKNYNRISSYCIGAFSVVSFNHGKMIKGKKYIL